MKKDYLYKEDNSYLLMTYYFPTYSTERKCKINRNKESRKYRLIKAGIKYIDTQYY